MRQFISPRTVFTALLTQLWRIDLPSRLKAPARKLLLLNSLRNRGQIKFAPVIPNFSIDGKLAFITRYVRCCSRISHPMSRPPYGYDRRLKGSVERIPRHPLPDIFNVAYT